MQKKVQAKAKMDVVASSKPDTAIVIIYYSRFVEEKVKAKLTVDAASIESA